METTTKEKEKTVIGVALYRIKLNGRLVGKWSYAFGKPDSPLTSTGVLGTEKASPVEPENKTLEGIYNVVISEGENKPLKGKLEIRKIQKNSYQLTWIMDNATKYSGYGVRRGRYLAADYWAV